MFSGFSRQYGYLHYLIVPKNAQYYQVRICGRICLPASAPTLFNLLFRQKAAVSQPRHHVALTASNGILTVSSIGLALRLILRYRLTPGRLTSPGKPWSYGEGASHPLIVTYTYICFSKRSSMAHAKPSTHLECSPTNSNEFHVFGVQLIPDYYPCLIPRLVSCYALFK